MKKNLFQILAQTANEEELKHQFVKFFKLPFSKRKFIDLYTEQILFEFKFNAPIKNSVHERAKIVAQALYYVHRLKFGNDERIISQNICVVTKSAAIFFQTEIFAAFYENFSFDWDRKPSAPCPMLISELERSEIIIKARIYNFSQIEEEIAFATLINQIRKRKSPNSNLKKQITEQNFFQIFQYWQNFFGEAVANGRKPSEYFITDIEQGKSSLVDDNSVIFRLNSGEIKEKLINPDDYKYFWSRYAKINSARDIIAIRQKMDRLTETPLRRRTGEFYTPLKFADKALQYLEKTLGKWYFDDNFRLWDMAAGTGNLEYDLPAAVMHNCYISTLLDDDTDYCKRAFPCATVFQFDFLNDSADKLPARLQNDLANPNIKWIIFINPPYATANNKDNDKSLIDKSGVSFTAIREKMIAENLKVSSQELTTQFLYRISKEFANRTAYLGIFSKLAYIQTGVDQKIRDSFFKYKFERGFVLSSQNFEGCKGKFPVGFLIWNLAEHISLHEQEILLDIYDSDVEKVGEKIFRPARTEEFLSKWLYRPKCTKKFPPMVSGLNFGFEHNNRVDRVAEGFLAGFMIKGNDFLNQNSTALLSAPYASHARLSITPNNFEQAMIVHMVRRLPKATWLNDRDQFLQPQKALSREFITDAVIWSLFAPSNQTASLRNVEYEGEIYQIRNNFYPFMLSEVENWECSSPEIRMQIATAHEDRFAALWIKNNRLSAEAAAVLNAGREIYKLFYANMHVLSPACKKYKIEDWDIGWYQIRMATNKFFDDETTHIQLAMKALSAKLEPQIYELGFLRDEVRYF